MRRTLRVSISGCLMWWLICTCSPSQVRAQTASPAYRGIRSCAAAGCHGGTPRESKAWRSAFSVWWNDDPHADAFGALYGELGQQIVRQLDPQAMESPAAYRQFIEQCCTSCHATPGPGDAPSLGVSCESCHGPAQAWHDLHLQSDWPTLRGTVTEFHDTRSLEVRAQTCVGCHVGESNESAPVREVNHDLIAAGHPPLRFEFSSYLANLPPHWEVDPTETEAERWRVGQAATSRAALQLLRGRAAAAVTETPSSKCGPVWPEFAEYSCFACHHHLAAPSPRQSPAGFPGRYHWSPWNDAAIPLLWPELRGLAELKAEMEQPLPDPVRVQEFLEPVLASLEATPVRPVHATRQDLLALFQEELQPASTDWEHAAHWQVVFDALFRGYVAAETGSDAARDQLELLLQEPVLQFPDGFASPRGLERDGLRRRDLQSYRNRLRTLVEQLE